VKDLASLINGHVEGDDSKIIRKPNTIEDAGEGDICFLADRRYETYLYGSRASAVLVDREFQPKSADHPTLIRVDDIRAVLLQLQAHFSGQSEKKNGISTNASLGESVLVGEEVYIGDYTVIEEDVEIARGAQIHPQVFIGKGCDIGEGTVIMPGVRIYSNSKIGKHCIIHSNAVIGSDGFGFVPNDKGELQKVPHSGNVIVEDNVEVGANTVIDRGSIGSTIIKKGVKLDNLIQIAHNVQIGENTGIAAQTGIAGSTSIGRDCLIGGQVGFVGHIKVGDKVQVQAQSGINKNIDSHSKLYGSPAMNYMDFLRSYNLFQKFPEIYKRLRALEEEMKNPSE
jgi:UDP-3-O-[3-hydroxymyristoyl] glucosamine N-acyltransferase